MKLRYVVELYYIQSFNALKEVSSIQEADEYVNSFKEINKSLGKTKYSCFTLYSDSDEIIKDYQS